MSEKERQPLLFINARNERIWAGKRKQLAHRDEVLRNLAARIGVQIFSPQRRRWLYAYMWLMEVLSFVGGVVVFLGVGIGVARVSADLSRFPQSWVLIGLGGALGIVLWNARGTFRHDRERLQYPLCVIALVDRLVANGDVTRCEICEVEPLSDAKCLLRYQFMLPKSTRMITGTYETTRKASYRRGQCMAVLYLDAEVHVLL